MNRIVILIGIILKREKGCQLFFYFLLQTLPSCPCKIAGWRTLDKKHENQTREKTSYYTEWSKSERETQMLYINAYIWTLEGWCWWAYLQGSSGDSDIESRLADTVGEGGGIDRAVSSHRPSCANQTARDKPLHSTGSSARCSLRTTRVG